MITYDKEGINGNQAPITQCECWPYTIWLWFYVSVKSIQKWVPNVYVWIFWRMYI